MAECLMPYVPMGCWHRRVLGPPNGVHSVLARAAATASVSFVFKTIAGLTDSVTPASTSPVHSWSLVDQPLWNKTSGMFFGESTGANA